MFAIPIQGFAAASMLFCGQGTAHHAQTQHVHPPGTPAHDHARSQPEAKMALDTGAIKLSDGKMVPDLMHKCSVCASCCNAVGIPPTVAIVVPDLPAHSDFGSPLVAVHSRPLLVPDKPPRA